MSSKSSQKNAKRKNKNREKKLAGLVEERKRLEEDGTPIQTIDPVVELKQQLAEAKASGDKKLAAKLRQDLWVLQDASSGHNIALESESVKESMERLQQRTITTLPPSPSQPPQPKRSAAPVAEKSDENETPSSTTTIEKEMKKIRKKLEQIEKLKKKQEDGDKLEDCQVEKIDKEELFKEQLAELEETLTTMKVVR